MQMEEFPAPNRLPLQVGDARSLIGTTQHVVESPVEREQPKTPDSMFLRPGFANVPSY